MRRNRPGSSASARGALDQTPRHVGGDGLDQIVDLVQFGEHAAADARVLQQAIDSLVAPHRDVGHGIDPQPRRVAPRNAAVKQLDLGRHLGKQRIERLVQQFEPRHLGVAQVDDDAGALGRFQPRVMDRLFEPRRIFVLVRLSRFSLTTPHDPVRSLGRRYTNG